ncbi:MAG: hypothetical protein AAGF11_15815 [Myxococcota bacterium]
MSGSKLGPHWVWSMLPLAVLGLACTIPAGKLGDVAPGSGSSGGGGDAQLPPEAQRVTVLELDDAALDLLVVTDNSGSMGGRQSRVAQAVAGFAQQALANGADLRIGFTTTDNGNPWCGTSEPEAGRLRLSSCASRLGDFVFSELIDVAEQGCTDFCDLESLALSPTTTHLDAQPVVRPWVEVAPGQDNLGGLDLEQTVLCAAPQGIDGCGFESHLESMHKALLRSESESDDSYGFLRPWARLAVVFVTDEVDCSVNPTWDIFSSMGSRVFWSDPDAGQPTSAVCWNAGVECENEGVDLGACNPQNFDVEGNVTDVDGAVMYSLVRFIEELEAIERSKEIYRLGDSVGIAVIGGVPEGYLEGEAELVYSFGGANSSAQFRDDFGVDPGCAEGAVNGGSAVPPVRLRTMAELFPVGDRRTVATVCRDDFSPVFDDIVQAYAVPRLEPVACIPGCLADVDSAVAGTQAQCDVVMTRAGTFERESTLVPACDGGDSAEACYRLRLDDDASECAQGSNAALELVLPAGSPVLGQATVEVACEMLPASSC